MADQPTTIVTEATVDVEAAVDELLAAIGQFVDPVRAVDAQGADVSRHLRGGRLWALAGQAEALAAALREHYVDQALPHARRGSVA